MKRPNLIDLTMPFATLCLLCLPYLAGCSGSDTSAPTETKADLAIRGVSLSVKEDTVLRAAISVTAAQSVLVTTLPSKGLLSEIGPDGKFTYTPNLDETGLDTFEVEALQNGKRVMAVSTIYIEPVNDAPTAPKELTIQGPETNKLDKTLSIADVDNAELTVSISAPPKKGVLFADNSGTLIYVPNDEATGEDTAMVTISDGELSTTTQINVKLTAPPEIQTTIDEF